MPARNSTATVDMFVYDGAEWWSREGPGDTAIGTIAGDSVLICDPGVGSCPNEIAYFRAGTLALYFTVSLDGKPADSADAGSTFVRGTWSTSDTIAPAHAPPPVSLSGVWRSDSVGASCSGTAQIGLIVSSPVDSASSLPPTLLQLNLMLTRARGFPGSVAPRTGPNKRPTQWLCRPCHAHRPTIAPRSSSTRTRPGTITGSSSWRPPTVWWTSRCR